MGRGRGRGAGGEGEREVGEEGTSTLNNGLLFRDTNYTRNPEQCPARALTGTPQLHPHTRPTHSHCEATAQPEACAHGDSPPEWEAAREEAQAGLGSGLGVAGTGILGSLSPCRVHGGTGFKKAQPWPLRLRTGGRVMLAKGPGQESRGAQPPVVPQPCSRERKPHSCLPSPPHSEILQALSGRSATQSPPYWVQSWTPQHCLALQTGNSNRKASPPLSGLGFQPRSLGHLTKENVPLPRPGRTRHGH